MVAVSKEHQEPDSLAFRCNGKLSAEKAKFRQIKNAAPDPTGHLEQYIPQKTDLCIHSHVDSDKIAQEFIERPR